MNFWNVFSDKTVNSMRNFENGVWWSCMKLSFGVLTLLIDYKLHSKYVFSDGLSTPHTDLCGIEHYSGTKTALLKMISHIWMPFWDETFHPKVFPGHFSEKRYGRKHIGLPHRVDQPLQVSKYHNSCNIQWNIAKILNS